MIFFQGDSGGPMVVQDEDQGYILSGIVSWGECGDFTAFTRVSEFRDWIYQYVQFWDLKAILNICFVSKFPCFQSAFYIKALIDFMSCKKNNPNRTMSEDK